MTNIGYTHGSTEQRLEWLENRAHAQDERMNIIQDQQNSPILDDRVWRRELIGMFARELMRDASISKHSIPIDSRDFMGVLCEASIGLADAIIAAEKGNGEKG